MSDQESVRKTANEAYDLMKDLGRDVPYYCPAPTVYSVLGNLKSVSGYFTTHALTSMAEGLERSLDGTYDVYDRKREPAQSVAEAAEHLRKAAELSRQVAAELELAQTAINSQGYETIGEARGNG